MQSSSTFIRISGPIPEITENLHCSLFEIVLLNIGKNPSKARYCQTGFFCSKYSWASAGCRTPGKLYNFYSFKLENSTSSTLTGTKLFCKYEYLFFLEKWQFNHKLGPPLYYKYTVSERLSSQCNKIYEIRGLRKYQFLNS